MSNMHKAMVQMHIASKIPSPLSLAKLEQTPATMAVAIIDSHRKFLISYFTESMILATSGSGFVFPPKTATLRIRSFLSPMIPDYNQK